MHMISGVHKELSVKMRRKKMFTSFRHNFSNDFKRELEKVERGERAQTQSLVTSMRVTISLHEIESNRATL